MGQFKYLECTKTHQCVYIATKTVTGGITGSQQSYLVIQLFALAHEGLEISVITDPHENSIEWDLGNCIELFEMVTNTDVDKDTRIFIQREIDSEASQISVDYEGFTDGWLRNYIANESAEFYGFKRAICMKSKVSDL